MLGKRWKNRKRFGGIEIMVGRYNRVRIIWKAPDTL